MATLLRRSAAPARQLARFSRHLPAASSRSFSRCSRDDNNARLICPCDVSFVGWKIVDPYLASYGAANPIFAVIQLAQTTMRSELGKMTLDKTFEERDTLNENIVRAINEAATEWGLKCLRYEISEAGAVLALAEASARGIRLVSEAMTTKGSAEAATLRVAEQYVRAFSQVAKKGNTILLPGDGGNPSSFVTTAFKICQRLQANSPQVEELEESGETETSEMPPPLIPDIDPGKSFSLQSGKNKA
ncbi:stomatin-like protein 2, mitochondrial [Panicum miliaceum]|uniref:Stomatin-like protein 2, mitochondrial n=1 Tax=Panicum miliaceum TaxID=4540 RepID=A0A3L6PQ78_PANMI|nr:stomatin-like protein 2, mitochondrial [Panicum miliaceum]